jgi:hypothetical protein
LAHPFVLPWSDLDVLRLILIGYLHEGGPERTTLGPASVGKAVGVDATVVSRNNEFLAALGLVETERLGRSRLTEAGARVARAFERHTGPELSRVLAPLLQEDDFVRRVLTYVGSRGDVERSELEHHVARAAGPPRNPAFPTGASALVDLILAAGLLVDDRGTIRMDGGVRAEATGLGDAAVDLLAARIKRLLQSLDDVPPPGGV